jgi:hypothetical protein
MRPSIGHWGASLPKNPILVQKLAYARLQFDVGVAIKSPSCMLCEIGQKGDVMNMKVIVVAAGIFAASVGGAFAQTQAPLPAAVTAAIQNAELICTDSPDQCEAAMATVVAALDAAGLTGVVRDSALASMATTLTSIGTRLPAAAQAEIASALGVLVSNLTGSSAMRTALTNIIAVLNRGEGDESAIVLAFVASEN